MSAESSTRYELRFTDLHNDGRGYSFPCDANGRVHIDDLGERARMNYFYARSLIGREFHAPVTCAVTASRTWGDGATPFGGASAPAW